MGRDFSAKAVIGWKLNTQETLDWLGKIPQFYYEFRLKVWRDHEKWATDIRDKLPKGWTMIYNESIEPEHDEFYLILNVPEDINADKITNILHSSQLEEATKLAHELGAIGHRNPKICPILVISY